jgi:hypothetical protein
LVQIHSLIDALEGDRKKLAPEYNIKFYVQHSQDRSVLDSDWRLCNVKLQFPSSFINSNNEAIERQYIENQLHKILSAAGVEIENQGKSNTETRIRRSSPKDNSLSDSVANPYRGLLRSMLQKEALLPSTNDFLDFVFDLPHLSARAKKSAERQGGFAVRLSSDEFEAAVRLSVLFQSGRVLVDDSLSSDLATAALRRLGSICLEYHNSLNLDHVVC